MYFRTIELKYKARAPDAPCLLDIGKAVTTVGLEQQLAEFRAEFARTAPPGRSALYEAKGEAGPLAAFPNLKRWFDAIDARPAVARARAVGKGHEFKKVTDEETKRALFPSNYPPAA